MRLGFLGLLLAGALAALAIMTRHSAVRGAAELMSAVALLTWCLGQALTYAVMRRIRSSTGASR